MNSGISWEVVIYPSLLLVDALFDHDASTSAQSRSSWLLSITLASAATAMAATAWDTLTDPMAVHVGYWKWDNGGAFLPEVHHGIPFSNFWGWLGATFLISFVYRCFSERARHAVANHASGPLFAVLMYTGLFLGAQSGLRANGLYSASFLGVFTMGPLVVLAWCRYFRQ